MPVGRVFVQFMSCGGEGRSSWDRGVPAGALSLAGQWLELSSQIL